MKRSIEQTCEYNKVPFKIVLLGDGCIGKSTLFDKLNNINNDYTFNKKYKATDNFDLTRLNIKTNKYNVLIDLWDTAGQENKGGMMRDAYIKGADGVLLLYDVTELKTKENINKWLSQIKNISPNIPIAVMGNKSDKFKSLQQSEAVKIRDCNLQSVYGCNNIKNFIISIKEDSHIEFTTSFWYNTNIVEKPNCLIGLEYVIGKLISQENIKIEY